MSLKKQSSTWQVLIVAAVVFQLNTIVAGGEAPSPLVELHAKLIAVSSTDDAKKAVDPRIRLQQRSGVVGITLQKNLERNGISMSGDVMTVVYELNPRLSELPAGALTKPLLLPSVAHDPLVKPDLTNGFLLMILLDEDVKGDLEKAIVELQAQVRGLDEATRQVGPPDRRLQVIESTNSIAGILTVVKDSLSDNTQPLSRDLLLQLKEDAQLATQSLTNILGRKETIAEGDVTVLHDVQEDLRLKAKNFNERRGPETLSTRWREVSVHIRVLNLKSPPEVKNLQVYYVPKIFEEKVEFAKPFEQLTPNAKKAIPEGNYFFWASSPGNGKRITLPKPGDVRVRDDGSDYQLDLVLEK